MSITDKVKARLVRFVVENNFFEGLENIIDPRIKTWVENNWLLYERMAEVANREVVIDSSKDRRIALLLHRAYKGKVYIIFLKRSVEGFAAAKKRWSSKNNQPYDIDLCLKEYKKYIDTIDKIIRRNRLRYKVIDYEDIVDNPLKFINDISSALQVSEASFNESDKDFFINPSGSHLVAGNPMRYRGKQKVLSDTRWKKELNERELAKIKRFQSGL